MHSLRRASRDVLLPFNVSSTVLLGDVLLPDRDLYSCGQETAWSVERAARLVSHAWEATALPLSYARIGGESLCGGAGAAQW